jgi:hypothetical protein
MIPLGVISIVWGGMALASIAAPSWWRDWIARQMAQPLRRLLWGQAIMVAGLVLIVGTSGLNGYWVWVSIGGLAVVKGLLLLGLPAPMLATLLEWWRRRPLWVDQIAGVVSMALATLLAIDFIRAGR